MAAAFVLPGQGDYVPGCLEEMSSRSPVAQAEIAGAREVFLTDTGVDIAHFFGPDAPHLTEVVRAQPEISQYLCFVSSLAAARVAEDEHGPPSVIVGHSLGEITALCAGRYLSTADGARIVVRRTCRVADALAGLQTGLLAVVGDRVRGVALVDVLPDEGLSVAGYNGEFQIVISGPDAALRGYADLATTLDLRCVRVVSPWAFHNPMLTGAAVRLRDDLSGLRLEQGTVPIYSPILGRFYRPGEAVAPAIASHLVRPFHFDRAIVELSQRGYRPLLALGSAGTLRGILRDSGAGWADAQDNAQDNGPAPKAGSVHVADGLTEPALGDAPGASSAQSVAPSDRATLLAHLGQMYAAALEYPADVFDEQVDLEADLGVDSVKQTELLSRVSERYDLPAPNEDFRVGDYPTLGRVADLVLQDAALRPTAGATEPAERPSGPAPQRLQKAAGRPDDIDRITTLAELVEMYATALEYPPDVFDENVELEAELGVDSVKQTELLSRVSERYGLPTPTEEFRVGDYPTLGKVVDLVVHGVDASILTVQAS